PATSRLTSGDKPSHFRRQAVSLPATSRLTSGDKPSHFRRQAVSLPATSRLTSGDKPSHFRRHAVSLPATSRLTSEDITFRVISLCYGNADAQWPREELSRTNELAAEVQKERQLSRIQAGARASAYGAESSGFVPAASETEFSRLD